MKKFLAIICLLALTGLCRAASSETLTISDIYYDAATSSWGVNIGLENPTLPITALQCDIAVPETFQYTTAGLGYAYKVTSRLQTTVLGETTTTHTCTLGKRSNGTLRVVIYSADNALIQGTSGNVIFVALTPALGSTPDEAATFRANLTNQVLSYIDEAGVPQSVYPEGIINDNTLNCFDAQGNKVKVCGAVGTNDFRELNELLASNDRVVSIDITKMTSTGHSSLTPKNPNALIFASAAGKVANTENVFVLNEETMTAVCANLVLYPETQTFEMPAGYTATAEKFTFNRTFSADLWSSVMLPVSLSAEQLQSITDRGVKIVKLSDYNEEDGVVSYALTESFEANTPYFIRPVAQSCKPFDNLTNISVSPTATTNVVAAGNMSMHGVYDYTVISSTSTTVYYAYSMRTGNFFKVGTDCWFYPFRAYLALTGPSVINSSALSSLAFNFVEPTAIEAVEAEKAANKLKGAVYTIDGRRVQATDMNSLARGLYIINGKKVVVK